MKTEVYYKFWCPKCGSSEFVKKELVEMTTRYYNPPYNYNIFDLINRKWSWSSETTTDECQVDYPSFFCGECDYHVGNFKHIEDFIETGFEEGYIIKYDYEGEK